MRIRTSIRLQLLVMIVAVVGMAFGAYQAFRSSQRALDRFEGVHRQYEAIADVAVSGNQYSEAVAEMLLTGSPDRIELDRQRRSVTSAIERLRAVTHEDIERLGELPEAADERGELQQVESVARLFRHVEREVAEVAALQRAGKRVEAIALYSTQINRRLDVEFGQIVDDWRRGEREEVREAEALVEQFRKRTLVALGLLLLGLTAVALLTTRRLVASLSDPIEALSAGTAAVGRGELSHRIAGTRGDALDGLVERFNDMTEELERQRATIAQAQETLEATVALRTRQLDEANNRLRELDRQRLRLLADVSHELRTPLAALRGEAELTLRGIGKPEAAYRETLVAVVARSEELGRLIDDLMVLARSESDQLRFDFRRVQLSVVIDAAIKDARLLAAAGSIDIARLGQAGDCVIDADPRRIAQVLFILFDNAIKFSAGDARVEVEQSIAAGRCRVVVRNHGIGIRPADIPLVFEPFYRGHDARAAGVVGSGLGLPIAKRIIEAHGGAIALSSTAGTTEAIIELPISVAALPQNGERRFG